MTRPRKPKLPLRLIADDEGGIVLDALDETLDFAEVAWLNRAAEEWPLLRRALREAEERAKEARQGWRSAVDALRWCGGASAFQPEGLAREGWLKGVVPVLERWEERKP